MCQSLTGVSIPSTVREVVERGVAWCESLESVRFWGDAPRFKVFVPRTAFGWVRPYARSVPEKWPQDFGRMNAYPVEGYDIERPRGLLMSISKTDNRLEISVYLLGANVRGFRDKVLKWTIGEV